MTKDNQDSFTKIKTCRICKSENLVSVLQLGNQSLTGVFPNSVDEHVTVGPLELVWCPNSGLLQLKHSFDPSEMYGGNYGYRSGLNQSMIDHLKRKICWLEKRANLQSSDTVLDIGSNDCTSLKAYSVSGINRIGIDPTGNKFRKYYPDDVSLVPDFFSAENFRSATSGKAKIVTSACDVASILDHKGLWHLEQSYMPSMLRTISYDTICHEHLEYYSLKSIQFIMSQAGLKVIDVSMNSVNGGSFAVTVAHADNQNIVINSPVINWLLDQEEAMGLDTPRPYREFEERVFRHRKDLTRLIEALNADGKTILGYGASTKGNVVLQFCGFTVKDIPAIAEVNEENLAVSHLEVVFQLFLKTRLVP